MRYRAYAAAAILSLLLLMSSRAFAAFEQKSEESQARIIPHPSAESPYSDASLNTQTNAPLVSAKTQALVAPRTPVYQEPKVRITIMGMEASLFFIVLMASQSVLAIMLVGADMRRMQRVNAILRACQGS